MSELKYYSTNHASEKIGFGKALLEGQAPDKGLYLPERIPPITKMEIAGFSQKNYAEIAFAVAEKFLGDVVPEEKLREITKSAYDFEVPLEKIDGQKWIMRLDKGPTASFKDFAARMMARLMDYFLEEEKKSALVLVATSGDTGSAIANAFHGLENVKVCVLFPEKEVSERQRRQMTTLGGNVRVLAVNGKFDDCQKMVKQAFSDEELKVLNLTSANSINFGRLLPQAVYYFYAYSRLCDGVEQIIFSVPSGNFGDLMGGVIAREMGLPVRKFVVATNENDSFPKFMESGKYERIVPSRACLSNAMNVGHPSNLARLIDVYGGQMKETGEIIKMPELGEMQRDFFAVSVSDEETRRTIREAFEKQKIVLEPHGAVAWAGLKKFLEKEGSELKCVSFETADPAKFPEELVKMGVKVETPKQLQGLEEKKEEYGKMNAEYEEFKGWLKKNY
ncbi:threonine synthase [Candidatus Micrarchaeota archaeon]|nr:threonine synthase [Candidatus Micrarchaeota archaeon]